MSHPTSPRRAFLSTSLLPFLLPLLLGITGCGPGCGRTGEEDFLDSEGDSQRVPIGTEGPVVRTLVIPEAVAKTWKSVVLEVADRESGKKEEVVIGIGATAPLGNTGLTVQVEGFLPHFVMQPEIFTSASDKLENPAARVRITDREGKELFHQFLFRLYPDAHPFPHPRYQVTLKDYLKR